MALSVFSSYFLIYELIYEFLCILVSWSD